MTWTMFLGTNHGLYLCEVKWEPFQREREKLTIESLCAMVRAVHQITPITRCYFLANYLAGTNAAGSTDKLAGFSRLIDAGICRQIHAEADRQHRGPNSQHWFEGHLLRLSLHFTRSGGADWASLHGRALCVPGLVEPPMGDGRWTLHEG